MNVILFTLAIIHAIILRIDRTLFPSPSPTPQEPQSSTSTVTYADALSREVCPDFLFSLTVKELRSMAVAAGITRTAYRNARKAELVSLLSVC